MVLDDAGDCALYSPQGDFLEEDVWYSGCLDHQCHDITIRKVNNQSQAWRDAFTCYGGISEPEECDFEWPKVLDEEMLEPR